MSVESHLEAMNGITRLFYIYGFKWLNDNTLFLCYLVSINVNEVLSIDLPLTDLPVVNASNLNMGLKVRRQAQLSYSVIWVIFCHLAQTA